jgi:hypothetical protein
MHIIIKYVSYLNLVADSTEKCKTERKTLASPGVFNSNTKTIRKILFFALGLA